MVNTLSSEAGLSGQFLTSLGIIEKEEHYVSTEVNPDELEAAYRVLYALWGNTEDRSRGGCILL